MSAPAVIVDNLNVTFEVRSEARRLPFRRDTRNRPQVQAVKNVSLTVNRAESIGLLGHNGAGKSTLMRAIAGLLPVTSGSVRVSSQPHLLGVHAALINKLSGYKNIELGLLANEVRPADIPELAADVASFTELGNSLNYPVRTYSQGMRARLAFGIATVRVPEILLLDEALAVGDLGFKERSLERMRQIRADANSIIIATHNLAEILATCDRAIWMERGQIIEEGDAAEIVASYRVERRKS